MFASGRRTPAAAPPDHGGLIRTPHTSFRLKPEGTM